MKSTKIRKLVITGMLFAILVVLGTTPLGFIPIGPTKLTIMHLPVIIGAIIEGPVVGLIVGLFFGLFSLYQAWFMPNSPISTLFLNPLVSVLPRLLIGPCAYYAFVLLKRLPSKAGKWLPAVGAAITGTLINTGGVLTMLYLLYAAQYATKLGFDPAMGGAMIGALALTNGLPEAMVAVAIVLPTEKALRFILQKKGNPHDTNA